MEKAPDIFKLDFSRYLRLIETSIINPQLYSTHLKQLTLEQSLVFFIINSSLWLVLSSIIRTVLIQKYRLFFSVLSEILVLMIPLFLVLLLFTVFLYILAKTFGSRTKLKNNLKAVLFSSILLPFFAVPVVKVFAFIFSVFILIFCLKAVNRFDIIKATLVVVIPVTLTLLALIGLGILNINLILG